MRPHEHSLNSRAKNLSLDGLTSIDVDTARALGEFDGHELHLGLPKLTGDLAAVMADFKCGRLYFEKLTGIDAATAASLAAYRGRGLTLGGLEGLSVEAAQALAKFQGDDLILDGLTTLDAETAQTLAAFKGNVRLFGLTRLSIETARMVYERYPQKDLGRYIGITALDTPDAEQVARFLAGCEGALRLPRLEKISPKALNALLQKKDIILPPINSLELIPEPDGSPTVKVVIPEGYFERQKKEKRQRITKIP